MREMGEMGGDGKTHLSDRSYLSYPSHLLLAPPLSV
jgi:hypothetical protein